MDIVAGCVSISNLSAAFTQFQGTLDGLVWTGSIKLHVYGTLYLGSWKRLVCYSLVFQGALAGLVASYNNYESEFMVMPLYDTLLL